MKRAVMVLAGLVMAAAPGRAEEGPPGAKPSPVALGGGASVRYLRLNLSRWDDSRGLPLKNQDIMLNGGQLVASGPVGPASVRWRLGGFLEWGGNRSDNDIDRLQMALAGGGVTAGLGWRPSWIGLSADLNLGGAWILTDFKRQELAEDWDVFEVRQTGLFLLEPLMAVDFHVSGIFGIRLQGGYTFLWGRGEEVGGPTGGIVFVFGQWM